ncbi:toll/interleukin-1 receptor domain-containing protein [uncultured Bradyrhizobium sp.]|uniref:toll/interleukin-1 receptor domain-containing protein n=1 Tax=uncultured Bradyrhizobium sp. TaxID=199684 RepID=UPI002609B751|nr:toll/interleukin-1 receptor domain-containing protein [uncultured Bradyrhizobium sp.]
MRIFLSFPSELESQADSIAQSLRNCDHDVFFSHDDLPPGDSFDARVEKAIESSDFMVFLISPESVTRGRYTLSELAFARTKWPNPSNRVLPVMMAPTPLDQVPTYLKAVTILEPQGSAAAETRAAVDRMLEAESAQSRGRSIMPFLALALASAVACTLTVKYATGILQYSFVDTGPAGGVTVLPGLIFGLVVATCNFIFGIRDRFQLALVVAITAAAWIAAFDASSVTLQSLSQYSRAVNTPADAAASLADATTEPAAEVRDTLSNNPFMGYLIGGVGGAVGGAITILGVILTNPGFRRLDGVVITWLAAIAAGTVYGAVVKFPDWLGWLVLFGVWQPAFLLAMARGFPRGTAQIPGWLGRITAPILAGSRTAR